MRVGTFEDIKKDIEHGTYNYFKNGKCSECGNCCSRFLALNQREINTIRKYIERHGIKQQKHAQFMYAQPVIDFTCPFLDDAKPDHKCTIYEVRPLICREFRCDNWNKITRDNILYRSKLRSVDATHVFFGGENEMSVLL